jgi:hypothetical protein
MVQADKKLQGAGTDFAKTLFGKSEGRVVLNTSLNKLLLLLKKLEEEAIMKVSIGQVSETDAKPNTVTLELDALFDSDELDVRNEIAAKAKAGLNAMAQGSFALNACIGENEDYMIVYKFEQLGELSIGDAKEMQLYYDLPNCVDLNVRATIAGEKTTLKPKVMLKTNFNDPNSEMSASEQAGISEAWLELKGEGGATTVIKEYSGTEAGTILELEPVAGKEGLNEKEFSLCAKGDDGQLFQAIGKKLKVKAKSVSLSERLAEGDVGVKEMVNWWDVNLTACGLHPYKMLEKISAESANVKKDGKKIEAYTILVWKGDPEELTLKSMIAAWRAFKLKPGEEDEDLEGKTMEEKIQSAKTFSLWMYGAACAGATLACNIATSWIFGVAKAPADILFNCGIPLIAGFFAPQTSSTSGTIWDGIKDFLQVGQIQEKITNPVQQLVTGTGDGGATAEAAEKNLMTGGIFGISLKGIGSILSAKANTASFTSVQGASSAINTTAESIAGEMTDNWADTYIKGTSQGDALRASFKSDLKTRISNNLTKAAEEAAKKGKFRLSTLNLDGAANSAWSESSESLVTRIAADPAQVKGTTLGAKLEKAISAGADDVIESATVAEDATRKLTTQPEPGGLYRNTDDLVTDLTTKTMDELDSLVKANPKLGNLSAEIRTEIANGLRGKTVASADELQRAISNAVTKVKKAHAEDLFNAAKTNIDDLVRNEFKNPPAVDTKVPKGGRLKNFWTKFKDPKFWKTLGRGLVCGAISNMAGLSAQQAALNWKLGDLRAQAEESQGFDFTGPLSNYEGVEVFRKFKPYKITIEKIDDAVHVTIAEVFDEDITAMGKAITDGTAKYWKAEDCAAQLEQGIDELIGCLMPDSETEGVTQAQVKAYYTNNAKTAAMCIGDDPANRLDEALLMSVLFTSPENIEGCCDGDQCISGESTGWWYTKSGGEQEQAIECAAGELRTAMSAGSDRETVKKLAELSLDGQALEDYADSVLATYAVWQEFNFCEEGS